MPETVPSGLGLFWRTFLGLGLLLLGSLLVWQVTWIKLEDEPRVLQNARQIASLVNLTRAALMYTDPIARISLVKTLVEQENVRIAIREPSDSYQLYNQDELSRRISLTIARQLGEGTLVAREVNEFPGLWIGFEIGADSYWWLADPERVDAISSTTWVIWITLTTALSLLGSALLAGRLTRPLRALASATRRLGSGQFPVPPLDERTPTREIRELNRGFNVMARQLEQLEQDRTLMMAGISHDLRTPLARLRLELEMSVPDDHARQHMVEDVEQVDRIIGQFLAYARTEHPTLGEVSLADALASAVHAAERIDGLSIHIDRVSGARVQADPLELQRILLNLFENAARYARADHPQARVVLHTELNSTTAFIRVRDHGPGVPEAQLPQLTQAFFRGDVSRSQASGTGLGLAIVERSLRRMGGSLSLHNHPEGGLEVVIGLLLAPTAPAPLPDSD